MNKESIIFKTTDKEKAINLRSLVLSNFPRLWVYLYHKSGEYSISVHNEFSNNLPEDLFSKIQDYSKSIYPEDFKEEQPVDQTAVAAL
jgi:hypothetical protein